MALESFAEWLSQITPWSNLVLVPVAAYYLWKTFSGGEESKGVWGLGAEGLDKIKNATPWGKEGKEKKRVETKAKREKTALLNNYIEEEKELHLLGDAEKKLITFYDVVDVGISAVNTKKDTITKSYGNLLNAAKDAEKEIRKLKSRTWRQEKRAKALIEELEDDKLVDASKLTGIKAKEADILKLHDDLNKRLDTIMTELEDKGSVGAKVKLIENVKVSGKPSVLNPTTPIGPKKIPFATLLTDIKTALTGIKLELDGAEKDQAQSYKEVTSFVVDFEKLWK